MNTKKVTNILIIISVVIILMGIFAGKSVNLELKDNNEYVLIQLKAYDKRVDLEMISKIINSISINKV